MYTILIGVGDDGCGPPRIAIDGKRGSIFIIADIGNVEGDIGLAAGLDCHQGLSRIQHKPSRLLNLDGVIY